MYFTVFVLWALWPAPEGTSESVGGPEPRNRVRDPADTRPPRFAYVMRKTPLGATCGFRAYKQVADNDTVMHD